MGRKNRNAYPVHLPDHAKSYEIYYVFRPQHPHILKWVDREFGVIYINLSSSADANIVALLEDDEDDED